MARLDEREYVYFTTVRGMCRSCRRIAPARVFFRDGKVWQQSLCPDGDGAEAMIAGDATWYMENVLARFPDRSPLPGSHKPTRGCPHDCGPCTWHASPCQLPVVSVTNACDLSCPICFTYNRRDRLYFMPVEEMRRTVDWVVESSGPVDLINVTGGEPTLHPEITRILACCRRPEIGRVTMNSNGLRLAADERLCAELAELGVHVVLSFSTFDRDTSVRMHGRDVVDAKRQALENLTRAGVNVTLLYVMIRGVNENAAAGLLDLMRSNNRILSLTVQTMTYTGQGGGTWRQPLDGLAAPGKPKGRAHIPVDDAARVVCEHAGGEIEFSDFVTRPSAHPLCYLVCYLLSDANGFLPLARIAPREKLRELMKDSYLIRLGQEPGGSDGRGFFREVIDGLYARGQGDQLKRLRGLVETLYPSGRELTTFERQRRAESAVRTITIHAHMDEDTFDCSRAALCPDLVPAEPGRLIPACTYNLFYRMKDDRFYVDPRAEDAARCGA